MQWFLRYTQSISFSPRKGHRRDNWERIVIYWGTREVWGLGDNIARQEIKIIIVSQKKGKTKGKKYWGTREVWGLEEVFSQNLLSQGKKTKKRQKVKISKIYWRRREVWGLGKGLLSQGGWAATTLQQSTWWALHNHQIVFFFPKI